MATRGRDAAKGARTEEKVEDRQVVEEKDVGPAPEEPTQAAGLPAVQEAAGVPGAYDYGEDAGAGFEDTTREDYATPFLTILEALSPQVQPGGVEGARPGMICNTTTGELFDGQEGVMFLPVHPEHHFTAWRPNRGGFVARYEVGDPIVERARAQGKFGEYKDPEGNDLVDTFSLLGFLVRQDGTYSQVVVSFSSTRIKKYRALMTKAREVQIKVGDGRVLTPPLYAHLYRLRAVLETNKRGQTYHNWDVAFAAKTAAECRLPPNDHLYQEAKRFRTAALAGKVKVDYATQEAPAAGDPDAPF